MTAKCAGKGAGRPLHLRDHFCLLATFYVCERTGRNILRMRTLEQHWVPTNVNQRQDGVLERRQQGTTEACQTTQNSLSQCFQVRHSLKSTKAPSSPFAFFCFGNVPSSFSPQRPEAPISPKSDMAFTWIFFTALHGSDSAACQRFLHSTSRPRCRASACQRLRLTE